MHKFMAVSAAIHDPESVLKEIAGGSMDPVKTRALEAVAPATFRELSSEIERRTLDKIAKGKVPPQSELTKLHLAFGITIDPSLSPKSLATTQKIMAEPEPQPPPQRKPMNLESMTDVGGADRLER